MRENRIPNSTSRNRESLMQKKRIVNYSTKEVEEVEEKGTNRLPKWEGM